jgi:hypothetical protein
MPLADKTCHCRIMKARSARWSLEPTLMEGCRVEADANVDRLSEGEF